MIDDLSRTLEAVLDDAALATEFPQLFAAQIAFDQPDSTFSPLAPTIDLFLYDIRENLELRSNEPIVERNGAQATIRKPPRRIDCSYLVTAWPVGAAPLALPEQQLLGQALQVLGRYATIPEAFLQGSLVGQEPPLPMIAPQIDGLKSPADFWTAMGNQLRASFTVTATISMPTLPDATGPVVTSKLLGAGPGTADDTLVAIGGRVLAAGTGVADAVVDVVDAGLRTRTDADGRFVFPQVPVGNRTLRVVAVGFQPLTQAVVVPSSPEDYEFTLTPL